MKVFFLGDRTNEKYIEINKKIISSLDELGIKVDDNHLSAGHQKDASDFEDAFKRNTISIKNADFVVAEATVISSGLGFLVATALNFKKPVLALFNEDEKNTHISSTLKAASKNKLFSFNGYNENNIKEILGKYLKEVKQKLDTKFILIIPPEIDRYLEWASDHRRMHKAQIVRNAIEREIEGDIEWKHLQEEI